MENDADLSKIYSVYVKFEATDTEWKGGWVKSNKLFDTTKFNNDYVYGGNDLGVTYTPSLSTFKLWAPTSSSVELRLYQGGSPSTVTNNKTMIYLPFIL